MHIADLKPSAILIANTGEFTAKNYEKEGYDVSPLEDGSLDAAQLAYCRAMRLQMAVIQRVASLENDDTAADDTAADDTDMGMEGALADVCGRGKRSVAIDLKTAEGRELALRLTATADVLLEGSRPGVAERLGLGPEDAAAVNPRLIYGRMTGWGQAGPMAQMAGHDINYIGLVGALHAIGEAAPVPPLNLVGDYGGGALYLALGVLAAIDVAIVDVRQVQPAAKHRFDIALFAGP